MTDAMDMFYTPEEISDFEELERLGILRRKGGHFVFTENGKRSSNVVTMPKRNEAPNGKTVGASDADQGGNPDLFAQPAGPRR